MAARKASDSDLRGAISVFTALRVSHLSCLALAGREKARVEWIQGVF